MKSAIAGRKEGRGSARQRGATVKAATPTKAPADRAPRPTDTLWGNPGHDAGHFADVLKNMATLDKPRLPAVNSSPLDMSGKARLPDISKGGKWRRFGGSTVLKAPRMV